MNMSTKDAVRTFGMMLGIGGTYLVLRQAGVEPHLLRLVIALVCGIGIGFISEKLYAGKQQPPKP